MNGVFPLDAGPRATYVCDHSPMHCPYCQAPAFETTPQCPRCGFSLERVGLFYGVMPRLSPGVSDLAGVFRPRDIRRLNDAAARLHEAFPQISFSVVTTTLQPEQPLTAYAFWVFNRGGICSELARGGKSRDLLLTLDTSTSRASLMVGYGLEPFIGVDLLQDIIQHGTADFARERWVDGIVAVINAATHTLTEVAASLQKTYGLESDATRHPESPHSNPDPQPGDY